LPKKALCIRSYRQLFEHFNDFQKIRRVWSEKTLFSVIIGQKGRGYYEATYKCNITTASIRSIFASITKSQVWVTARNGNRENSNGYCHGRDTTSARESKPSVGCMPAASGTIDETIIKALKRKHNMAESVL